MNEDLKLGSIVWPNFCSPFSISCYAVNESCSTLAVGSYEGSIVLFKIDENENYINNLDVMKILGKDNKNVKENVDNKNKDEYVYCRNSFTINGKCKDIKKVLHDCKNNENSSNFEKTKGVHIDNVNNNIRSNNTNTSITANNNNNNTFSYDKVDCKNNLNKDSTNINNRINLLPYSILLNNNNNTCNNSILQLCYGLSCCSIVECISTEILISLHTDNMIYLWSLHEGRCFKVLKNFDFFIYNLRILPDRRFLLISGDKKVLLLDLWANNNKEKIASLIIDNYKNKDNKEETVIKNESDDNYIGDINDKYYSSSCKDSEINNIFISKENIFDKNNNIGVEQNTYQENTQINNKKNDDDNDDYNNNNNNKICSIATGLVPYLKEENQKSLIQCFKFLKRKLFSIQEKKEKDENFSNQDFAQNYEIPNELNEEYIKIKENNIKQNLNNLFYCPVLICASLNNGDILCWDLTDFLNYYKSKCRFIVRTEKTEIELFNEIIDDIAENCIYDDIIKRRLNFSRDINLKTYDKFIKHADIYKQNSGLYIIEPNFISNLQKSQNTLEIATNGNSSQIAIIDNYIIILQKTRLIIYERKNSSSFFVPLMDLFCPDYQKSQKKKNSHWVGLQVLRRPIWKFSSGVFKSISFKKKSFNIMQKLSKNVCGSIIAWTTEGNFYCYTLPLKFSSLFLSFQSNIKSFFLTKISKRFLGSFKSPVPIIIYRKKLSKSKEKEKKKNKDKIEIKVSESCEIPYNENKKISMESIKSFKIFNDDDNSLKNSKHMKRTNNVNMEKYSKSKDDLLFFFVNKNYMNRIISFEYLPDNWYKTSKIEKVWLLPKQKNIKKEISNMRNFNKKIYDRNIENNIVYTENIKNITQNGNITQCPIKRNMVNEHVNKNKRSYTKRNGKIASYAIVEYKLNIYIIISYVNGVVTSILINTYKEIPKNKLIFDLPFPNDFLKKKNFITTLLNENNYLIGGSSKGDILIWDVSTFKLVKYLKNCHLSYVCSIHKVINENFILNEYNCSNKIENHWILSCDATNNLILLNIDKSNYENNKDNFFCKNDEYKIVISTDEEINLNLKRKCNLNYINTFFKKRNLIKKENKYNLLKSLKLKRQVKMKKLRKHYFIFYNNTLYSKKYSINWKKKIREQKENGKLKNMTHVCFHCCFKKLEKKNEINFKLISNIYINTYSFLLYIILLNNCIYIYNYNDGLFLRSIYDSEFKGTFNFSYDKCYIKLGVNITNFNILNKIKFKYNESQDAFKNKTKREYMLPYYMNENIYNNSTSSSSSTISSTSSSISFFSSENIRKLDKIKENNKIINILNEKIVSDRFNIFYKGKNKISSEKTQDLSFMRKNNLPSLKKKIDVSNGVIRSQIPIISFVLFRDNNLSKKSLPLTKLFYHYFLSENCINICKELFPFLIDFPSIPFSLCIHGVESSFSFIIPLSTQMHYFSRMHSMKCRKYGDVYVAISNVAEDKYLLKKKRKKLKYFYDCLNVEYDFSYSNKLRKNYFFNNIHRKKYIYLSVKMGSLKKYSKDFKELSRYKIFKKYNNPMNSNFNNNNGHNMYNMNHYSRTNKIFLDLLKNNKGDDRNYSNTNIYSDYFKNEYNKNNSISNNSKSNYFNENSKDSKFLSNKAKRRTYNMLHYNYSNDLKIRKKKLYASSKSLLNYSDDYNTNYSSDKSSIYLYIRKDKKRKKKKTIAKREYFFFNNTINIYCDSSYVKTLYCCFILRFLNMWCFNYDMKYNDDIINNFKKYIVDNLSHCNSLNLFLLSYISMYPYDKSIRLQLQKFLLTIIRNISEKTLDRYTKTSTEVLRINNKKRRITEKNIDEISLYDSNGTYIISIIIPKIGGLFLYPFIYADEICLTLLLLLLVAKAEYLWKSKTFYANANMTTLLIHHICYYIFVDTKYFLEKNNKFNKFKLFHFIHLLSLSFSITWDFHILTQKGIFTNNMKNSSNISFNLSLRKEDFKFNEKLVNNNYYKTLKNYYIVENITEEKSSNSLNEINIKNYIEDYLEYADKYNETEVDKDELFINSNENIPTDINVDNNNLVNRTNELFRTSKIFNDKYYHKYMHDDDKSTVSDKNKSVYCESYKINNEESEKEKNIPSINEHNYMNICHFILNIFELYSLSLNNISFLKILINIGRIEPFLFLKTLHYMTANVQKRVSSINKILFLLIVLIKNYKNIFIYYLNIIIDILLNSLDPSNNVRILCLKLSTCLIYTLVKHYPICSFNKFTQKLAVVNNINKCIYLYDLKNAKKLKIFQGHKKNINCIKFNTNGSYLASYSKLDLSFKLWNCTNTGLFSGFLKIQSKYARDIQLSRIKISYLYLSDDYIDIVYKKKNEWILKREDNASYLIFV